MAEMTRITDIKKHINKRATTEITKMLIFVSVASISYMLIDIVKDKKYITTPTFKNIPKLSIKLS